MLGAPTNSAGVCAMVHTTHNRALRNRRDEVRERLTLPVRRQPMEPRRVESTSLTAAGRGLALALLVAGAVWLATLPAVTCRSTEFLGCFWPTVATVILIAVGGISTSLLGARLLGLPWFWLIALSGCAAMYAGAFALARAAAGLPYWVGFTTSALLWFPAAAMLAQPDVSRWLWVAAAVG